MGWIEPAAFTVSNSSFNSEEGEEEGEEDGDGNDDGSSGWFLLMADLGLGIVSAPAASLIRLLE